MGSPCISTIGLAGALLAHEAVDPGHGEAAPGDAVGSEGRVDLPGVDQGRLRRPCPRRGPGPLISSDAGGVARHPKRMKRPASGERAESGRYPWAGGSTSPSDWALSTASLLEETPNLR